MRIIADENIPFAREAFAPAGEVRFMTGRSIAREDLMSADALVVRSITRVTTEMLAGSPVRFVGTATAGTDHLDLNGLARAGIMTASAGGSNAESVAQHVAAVLCLLHREDGAKLEGKQIGIVGAGYCGSRVERVVRALGMEPVVCDPPLARRTGDERFRPLSDLRDCDFLTLHVPLTHGGDDATEGMIGKAFFAEVKPGMRIIQASRGGVVDERALIRALQAETVRGAALDVWENEPQISPDMLDAARVATPHIAGHSFDAKLLGTEMMHAALCRFAGLTPSWQAMDHLPKLQREVTTSLVGRAPLDAVAEVVLQVRPLMDDDSAMRELTALPVLERGGRFDAMRRGYPERREFRAWSARIEGGDSQTRTRTEAILRGLGFRDLIFD